MVIWALGNHLQCFHLVKHQFGVPLSWSTSQRVEPKFQHLMSPTPGVVHGTSSLKLFRFQTDFYLIWKNSMGILSPGPELHTVCVCEMATSLLELCAWCWFVRRVCVCGSGWLRQEAQKYPDRVSAVLAKCQDERLLNVCQPY